MAGRLRGEYNQSIMTNTTKYEEQNFSIPELKGISKKTIDEHLKLYAGYVKNANLITEKLAEYFPNPAHAYAAGELQRRFAFEFDGMRNHECYFRSLEGGAKPLPEGSALKAQAEKQVGSFDSLVVGFKAGALATRGIGWAMLSWDANAEQLTFNWCDEQHLGQLADVRPVLFLDMWEHSYLFDYVPADKKKYVEAFFENLNWEVIEANFKKASGR